MRLFEGWDFGAILCGAFGAGLRVYRLARTGSVWGTPPRRSWRQFSEAPGQHHRIGLIRAAGGQRELDPGDFLGDPRGDLDQGETDGVELRIAPE